MKVTRRQIKNYIQKLILEATYQAQSSTQNISTPSSSEFRLTTWTDISSGATRRVGEAATDGGKIQGQFNPSDEHKHYVVTGDIDQQLIRVINDNSTGTSGDVGEYLTGEVCSLINLHGAQGYVNLNISTPLADQTGVYNLASKAAGSFKGADIYLSKDGSTLYSDVELGNDGTLDFTAAGVFVSAKMSRRTSPDGGISTQKPSLKKRDQEDVTALICYLWAYNNLQEQNRLDALKGRLVSAGLTRGRAEDQLTRAKNILLNDAGASYSEIIDAMGSLNKAIEEGMAENDPAVQFNKTRAMDNYNSLKDHIGVVLNAIGVQKVKISFDAVNICGLGHGTINDVLQKKYVNHSYVVLLQSKDEISNQEYNVSASGMTVSAAGKDLGNNSYKNNLATLYTSDFKFTQNDINPDSSVYYAKFKSESDSGESQQGIVPGAIPGLADANVHSTAFDAAARAGSGSLQGQRGRKDRVVAQRVTMSFLSGFDSATHPAKLISSAQFSDSIDYEIQKMDQYIAAIEDDFTRRSGRIKPSTDGSKQVPDYDTIVDPAIAKQAAGERGYTGSISMFANLERTRALKALLAGANENKKKLVDLKSAIDQASSIEVLIDFLEESRRSVQFIVSQIQRLQAAPSLSRPKAANSAFTQDQIAGIALGYLSSGSLSYDEDENVQALSVDLRFFTALRSRIITLRTSVIEEKARPAPPLPDNPTQADIDAHNAALERSQSLSDLLSAMVPDFKLKGSATPSAANQKKLDDQLEAIYASIVGLYNTLIISAMLIQPQKITYLDYQSSVNDIGLILDSNNPEIKAVSNPVGAYQDAKKILTALVDYLESEFIVDINLSLGVSEDEVNYYDDLEDEEKVIDITPYLQADKIDKDIAKDNFNLEEPTYANLTTQQDELGVERDIAENRRLYDAILTDLLMYGSK